MSMSFVFYDGGWECKYCHLVGKGEFRPHSCITIKGVRQYRTEDKRLIPESESGPGKARQ
jgi:hypothetical protein